MPPKKAAAVAPQKKAAAPASHPSYRDMIKEAILQLKERNGSSRAAIKKYVLANNKSLANSNNVFDAQFNKAIRSGVEKGEFAQPKGTSGTVKLAKKEPAAKESDAVKKPAAAKKTAAKKEATVVDAAPKKKVGAPKKATKAAATKKAPTTKKAGAKAKPTANTASKRKAPPAPAVTEPEKILGKTKTGRITKNLKAPAPAPSAKKAAPKKTAAKKAATPKKTATPKKAATPKKTADSAAA